MHFTVRNKIIALSNLARICLNSSHKVYTFLIASAVSVILWKLNCQRILRNCSFEAAMKIVNRFFATMKIPLNWKFLISVRRIQLIRFLHLTRLIEKRDFCPTTKGKKNKQKNNTINLLIVALWSRYLKN